jgi:lipid-binding SYLF domain-containing protein
MLKKIPPRIIQNAVGLAVFTSMRSGLWTSGSGGSGVLIARKPDGTWSPPSGLMLQTATLGFVLGVDIYDCVVVINSFTTLEVFGRPKVTLGTDVQMTGGPLVSLGLLENEFNWADLSDTVFTYVKSKGQATEVKLDGTILNERADENERFYGSNFSVPKILAGDINQSLPQVRPLTEILKAAEGRTDFDANLIEQLASQPTPGDATIESPISATSLSPSFGLPTSEDPDPFGVLALELAGMEIREAGTRSRPDSSQFEYCPSPTSSAFPKRGRQSVDTYLSRSNRGSYMSSRTMATERSHMTDAFTQTGQANTAQTTPSPGRSEDGHQRFNDDVPEIHEPVEVDYTQIDISALRNLSAFPDLDDEPTIVSLTNDDTHHVDEPTKVNLPNDDIYHFDESASPKAVAENEVDADDEDEDGDDEEYFSDDDIEFEDAEEPVIYEVATAQPPRLAIVAAQAVQVKGAVVNIPRRIPPPLPLRSPARMSRRSKSEFGDVSMMRSPLRQEFDITAQLEDATTPTPGEAFSPAVSSVTDTHEVVNDSTETEEPKRTTTPTQETIDYYSTLHSQEPQPENAANQTPMIDEQAVEFRSTPGVPVSVA